MTRCRIADEDYFDSGVESGSDGGRPSSSPYAIEIAAESEDEHSAEDSGEDGSDDDQHQPPTQEEIYKHPAVFMKTLHHLGQNRLGQKKKRVWRCGSNGIIKTRFHQVRSLELNSSLGGSQWWTAC